MPTGSAGEDANVPKTFPLVFRKGNILQVDLVGIQRKSAKDRVADGGRLLINFLEHEMLVAALFSHDRIP